MAVQLLKGITKPSIPQYDRYDKHSKAACLVMSLSLLFRLHVDHRVGVHPLPYAILRQPLQKGHARERAGLHPESLLGRLTLPGKSFGSSAALWQSTQHKCMQRRHACTAAIRRIRQAQHQIM